MDAPVLTERRDDQLWLWLNRPERLNAVSEDLYERLIGHVAEAPEQGARVIVLGGKGRAFCVGADLKAHRGGRTTEERARYVELGRLACEALRGSPLPVVTAVHGYALGAGAELALNSDFVLIADDAEIGFPEITIGTYVGGGITWLLPRLVGLTRARELLFLGERIDGVRAADWGLAHAAVPREDLEDRARTLAERLSEDAPIPAGIAKRHLLAGGEHFEALAREEEALLSVMETEDWAEGVAAFGEKRHPKFKGR